MSNQASATIIQFPRAFSSPLPPVGQAPLADASSDSSLAHERLVNAMRSLETALEEQQRAVATWRSSLDQLRSVTTSIGRGLNRFQDRLDRVQSQVTVLNREATRLERWADGAVGARP